MKHNGTDDPWRRTYNMSEGVEPDSVTSCPWGLNASWLAGLYGLVNWTGSRNGKPEPARRRKQAPRYERVSHHPGWRWLPGMHVRQGPVDDWLSPGSAASFEQIRLAGMQPGWQFVVEDEMVGFLAGLVRASVRDPRLRAVPVGQGWALRGIGGQGPVYSTESEAWAARLLGWGE